jgi:DNA repair protein RecN (Recombination protein N)
MLSQLAIRDIVLIDKLVLNFREGLSVLTGETGAGKSILLDAFALALGGRGDGRLVRHGEGQGAVTAVFDVPLDHPARALAAQAEIDTEGDLILRRVQMADGRTRAFVNDQAVGVQALRAIGAALVEIHGQHDDRALADPTTHRAILDAFGGLQEPLAQVAEVARRVKAARSALAVHRARVEAAAKEADFLRHAVGELETLAPEPGEETSLAERRTVMQQSEKVARELNEAIEASGGGIVSHLSAGSNGGPRSCRPWSSPASRPSTRLSPPSTRPTPSSTWRCARPNSIHANWSGWKSDCSPCGPLRASFRCRSTISPPCASATWRTSRRSMPARRLWPASRRR